jgi:hypothetical protein
MKLKSIKVPEKDAELMAFIAANKKVKEAELYRQAISEFLSKYDSRLTVSGLVARISTLIRQMQTLEKIVEKGAPKLHVFPIVPTHSNLKEYGKAILRQFGFEENEIFEEPAGWKPVRPDVLGKSTRPELNTQVVIECGTLEIERLSTLRERAEYVLHIPYTLTPETFPYPTAYQVAYNIWNLNRAKVKLAESDFLKYEDSIKDMLPKDEWRRE